MLDEFVKENIKLAVKDELANIFEPLKMLKNFENVEQLTLDEVCALFRREPNEHSKQWIRGACKRGEIPHVKIGDSYLFPKRQMVLLLLGEWKPAEKEKPKKVFGLREVAREFVG